MSEPYEIRIIKERIYPDGTLPLLPFRILEPFSLIKYDPGSRIANYLGASFLIPKVEGNEQVYASNGIIVGRQGEVVGFSTTE